MHLLMPILKPAGYRKEHPLFFKKTLFDSAAAPIIAFGIDKGDRIEYEGARDQEDYDKRFADILQQSLLNLKNIQPEINIQDAEGTKIAFVTGHEYTSEKILDTEFMQALSAKLDASSLMVGIPFKGHLIATDSNSQIRLKFPAVIKKYYDNPQQDPISEYIFLVQDGNIVAIGGENIKGDNDQKFSISEDAKTNNYNVKVSCKTIDELTETVNLSFQQILLMVTNRKIFGGQIIYHLDNSIALTDQLRDKCKSYVEQIEKNEMAQLLTEALSKSKLQLSFYYAKKQITGKREAMQDSGIQDYSALSEAELQAEFHTIVAIPNARTSIEALTRMSALMKEFKKRGLELPAPGEKTSDVSKKWWQFWK